MLRPSDRDRLLAGFDRLSFESRYWRFFTPMPALPESVLRSLLAIDGWDNLAIAADAGNADGPTEGFGIARFNRIEHRPDVAMVAIAVVDHMQHRGLGMLLLQALAAAARERGIRRFRAEVLRANAPVVALLRDNGGDFVSAPSHTVAVYEVSLRRAVEQRERQAAAPAASMPIRIRDPIMASRFTMAVTSEDPEKTT